jgi:iron complex outermembrane recepter protein
LAVSRDRNVRDDRRDIFVRQPEVTGRVATGPLAHRALFGLEQEPTDSRTVSLRSNIRTNPFSIGIDNAVYGQALPALTILCNNIERITSTAL